MQDDQLAALASMRLDPYSSVKPQFVGVLDTNALLSSVGNDCRHGPHWRSRLLRMTDHGTAVLYAAEHVYDEAYERLPRIAASSQVPLAVLRRRFEDQYLPALRVVTVATAMDEPDTQIQAITDIDDVPTGQLAKLIAPCIVFSEDKHLRKPGLAPPNWRGVAQFGVDLADAARKQRAPGTLVAITGQGVLEFVQFLGRRAGVSPWLVVSVMSSGLALLLTNPERRRTMGRYIIPAVERVADLLEEAMAQEQHAVERLREVLLPAPEEPSIRQRVAAALTRRPGPLLAREVQDRMRRYFPDDMIPTVTEVRAVLHDGSEFVPYERYRWQFGREVGPQ